MVGAAAPLAETSRFQRTPTSVSCPRLVSTIRASMRTWRGRTSRARITASMRSSRSGRSVTTSVALARFPATSAFASMESASTLPLSDRNGAMASLTASPST